jgi:hypothetical protein
MENTYGIAIGHAAGLTGATGAIGFGYTGPTGPTGAIGFGYTGLVGATGCSHKGLWNSTKDNISTYYYNKYSFLQKKYFIKSCYVIIGYNRKGKYILFENIEYDYDFILKTKDPINKEFIAWYYHPSRMEKWIDDEDMSLF